MTAQRMAHRNVMMALRVIAAGVFVAVCAPYGSGSDLASYAGPQQPAVSAPAGSTATRSGSAAPDGAALYKQRCQLCHLATGDSKLPNMSFADGIWVHGSSVQDVAQVIRNGVKGTAMMPFRNKLSDAEIDALARYVRTFDKHLR